MRRLRRLVELGDVRAGDKRASLTADYDCPDASIRIGRPHRGQQARPYRLAERVDGRIIHFDNSDIPFPFDGDSGTHGSVMISKWVPRNTCAIDSHHLPKYDGCVSNELITRLFFPSDLQRAAGPA